jgi:prepilin-type N-terminal cleavage/methylation domain-containing protein
MGGWGLVRRILSRRRGHSRAAQRGFTFIEVMIALSISVVVLLANIYLFNTAHRDLALARSITEATNLATSKIADFRAMTIAQINAASPTVSGGANPLGIRQGSDTLCPDCPDSACSSSDCSPAAIRYTRTWVVSAIDLELANPPVADLVGDLVKAKIDVTWTLRSKDHRVSIATFTTGKTQ